MKEQAKVEVVPCKTHPRKFNVQVDGDPVTVIDGIGEDIYCGTLAEANTKADSLRAAQEREIPAAICTNPKCEYPDITHSVEMMGCIEARVAHSKQSEPEQLAILLEMLQAGSVKAAIEQLRHHYENDKVLIDRYLKSRNALAASPSPVCRMCNTPMPTLCIPCNVRPAAEPAAAHPESQGAERESGWEPNDHQRGIAEIHKVIYNLAKKAGFDLNPNNSDMGIEQYLAAYIECAEAARKCGRRMGMVAEDAWLTCALKSGHAGKCSAHNGDSK